MTFPVNPISANPRKRTARWRRLPALAAAAGLLATTLLAIAGPVHADSTGTLEEQPGWADFSPPGVMAHVQEGFNKLYGASSLHLYSTQRYSGTWVATRLEGLTIDDPRYIQFWINGVGGTQLDVKITTANGTFGQHTIEFSDSGWDYVEIPVDTMSTHGTNVDAGTTPYITDVASIEFAMWTDWMGTAPGQLDWYIDALKIQSGHSMEEMAAWDVTSADTDVFDAAPDTSVRKHGTASLRLQSDERQTAPWWTGAGFDGFHVQNPSTIRFLLRSDTTTPLVVKVSTGDGTFADELIWPDGSGEWQEIVVPIRDMNAWGTRVTLNQQPYIHQVRQVELLLYTPYMGSTPGTQTWWVDDLTIDDSLDELDGWTAFGPDPDVMAVSYDTERYASGTRSLVATSAERWGGSPAWTGLRRTGLAIEHPTAIELRGWFPQSQPFVVKVTDVAGTTFAQHLFAMDASGFKHVTFRLDDLEVVGAADELADIGTIELMTYTDFLAPAVGEVSWLFDDIDIATQIDYTVPLSRWSAPQPALTNAYDVDEVTLEEQAGWTAFTPSASVLDHAPSTTTKRYGDASMRIFSATRDVTQNNWVGVRKTPLSISLPPRSVRFWLYSPNGTEFDVKLTTTNDTFAEVNLEVDHEGWNLVEIPIEDFTTWGTNVTNNSEPYIDDVETVEILMHSSWMGTAPGTLEWFVDDLRIFTSTSHQLSFVMHDIWHDIGSEHINPDVVDPQLVIDTVEDIAEQMYSPANLRINLVHRGFGDDIDVTDPDWIADMSGPIDWFREHGIEPWIETHLMPFAYEDLLANDQTYVDEQGRTLDEVDEFFGIFHGHDVTNSVVLEATKDKAAVGPSILDAGGVTDIDYVWPYVGGTGWGFSDASKQEWKTVLQELDGGIDLTDGSTLHFWDYFEDYNGFTLAPADLGYTSWTEYEPEPGRPTTDQAKRNQYVENMLYHYEWLKVASDTGRAAIDAGGELNPVTHNEHTGSGTDLVYLAKAKDVGMPLMELWFTPDVLPSSYLAAPYFAAQYDANGKRTALVSETAAAGGNPFLDPPRPHYWDNEANYLINYTLQGIWDFDTHEENYWGAPYDQMTNPANNDWYVTYVGHRASLNGTLRAAEDQVTRPDSDTLSIVSRAVTGHESVPLDRGGDGQAFNLAQPLSRRHFHLDQAGLPLGATDLDDYQNVLYSARETPAGFFDDLRDWLDGASGRTLVTHSFVPKREIDGVSVFDADPTAIDSAVDGDTTLGLGTVSQTNVTSGTIDTIAPGFAPHLDLGIGDAVSFPQPLTATTNGTPLVTVGGNDLVTEVTVGGSRVIYLNFVPVNVDVHQQAGAVQTAIIEAVMRYLGEEPYAVSDTGEYSVLKLTKPDADVFTVLDHSSAESFPEFQARDIHATGSVQVVMAPSTQYEITDVLTGATELATSDSAGRLTIGMDGYAIRTMAVGLP